MSVAKIHSDSESAFYIFSGKNVKVTDLLFADQT